MGRSYARLLFYLITGTPMLRDYEIEVRLKGADKDVFNKSYKIALWDELVWNKNPKEHNLTAHVEGLITQLRLNTKPLVKQQSIKKRQIYTVNFSSTIGSEITGIRPALVITPESMGGEDVTVIPLTSALGEKLKDKHDLILLKDNDNKLYQNSYLRLRQIRAVSINRLGKLLGEIKNEAVRKKIGEAINELLAPEK